MQPYIYTYLHKHTIDNSLCLCIYKNHIHICVYGHAYKCIDMLKYLNLLLYAYKSQIHDYVGTHLKACVCLYMCALIHYTHLCIF